MYIVLFCSFFFVDIIKNKFLILFILTPILLITIGSFHISNIDGIIENLTSDDKTFYSKFAIRKYRYILEHIMGHIYYLTVIFLIYTFFNKEKTEKKYDKDLNIKNNELLENIIPKNEDKQNKKENNISNLEDDLYESKSEESESSSDSDSSDSDSYDENEKELIRQERKATKLKFNQPQRETIKSFGFSKLLIKKFFIHIDIITLVIIYFVAVSTVNITHIFLVLIYL